MARTVVAITGMNAGDNPGPGVGVARSIRADEGLDVDIIGLGYDAMEPGLWLDWVVDRACLMPYPGDGGAAVVERLLELRAAYGLDVVIPCLDAELPLYMRYRGEIAEHGIRVVLPSEHQFRLRAKDRLADAASAWGMSTPATEVLTGHDLEGVAAAVARLGLPLMVKGCYYEAWRAETTAEVHTHIAHLAAEWGWPVLLQQVVAGDHLNVVGVGDGCGGHVGLVAMKKLGLTRLGKVWTGVTVRHTGVLVAAEQFVRATRWNGPFEIECLVSGADIHLIEINPRFPAWCHLAAGVGVNLGARLVRLALGLPCPRDDGYPAGKLFIRYTSDVVADLQPFQALVTTGADR